MHESARYVPCFSVKGEKIKERYAGDLRGDTIAF